MDQSGAILRAVKIRGNAYALSLSADNKLIFSLQWTDTKIYRCDRDVVSGLCHSANGDLLVSMRSVDKTKSRVVRYSCRVETIVIQNDSQGTLLFSVGTNYALHLTEDGNGDICVADYVGEAVIVVNAFGKLRFKSKGNISPKSKYRQ